MKAKQLDINWNPDLSIYASEPFLKTVGDKYGWLGGIDDLGQLRCILPYTIVNKAIFRMVRFRVETIPLDTEFDIQKEKLFLNNAMEFFRSIGADMIIPATTNTIFRTYPDGADAAPYGTYIIDLSQPEETLWSNLNTSHRRNIRRAIKKEVQIDDGKEQIPIVYELVMKTFQRSKLPFMDFNSFNLMITGLGDKVKIFLAKHQGAVQGCTVIPFSNHCAYYVYGGSITRPLAGANNLLHWHAIQQFKKEGVQQYDFVGVRINPEKGSKQEGLLTFKKRFGGQLSQGYMWKYSINRLKYIAYSLAVRFLRGGDIVDSERHKLEGNQSRIA